MATWWVNQGSTYAEELRLQKLWAPLSTKPSDHNPNGARRDHWDRMEQARPGDLVVHFVDKAIRAWSEVVDESREAPRPYPSDEWEEAGRQLVINPVELDMPIPLTALSPDLRAPRYEATPFRVDGNVKLGYFFRLDGGAEAWARSVIAGPPAEPLEGDANSPATVQATFDYQGDTVAQTHVRGEQKWLRSQLFPGDGPFECALCGRMLPSTLLVAAHIKPRSQTTSRERQSSRVAMPACALGCDILFERGFVVVSDTGRVIAGPRGVGLTHDLRAFREALLTRVCSAFDADTKKYFRAHRKWHQSIRDRVEELGFGAKSGQAVHVGT